MRWIIDLGAFVLDWRVPNSAGNSKIRIAQIRPTPVRAMVLVATFVRNPVGAAARLAAFLAPLLFRFRPPAFGLRLRLRLRRVCSLKRPSRN